MQTARNRWSDAPRKDANGKIIPVRFVETDFPICALLDPSNTSRDPWSYQYLPTSYIPLLLGRGTNGCADRCGELFCRPGSYLAQPDQPRNNYRDIIWNIGKGGIMELRDAGFTIRDTRLRRLPHELMVSLVMASIEYGAKKHNLPAAKATFAGDFIPDRAITLAGRPVFIEADTGTETLEGVNGTNIAEKFEQYLKLITLRASMVLFVTTRQTRRDSMIALLRKVIDGARHDRDLARHFAFSHIEYTRYFNKIPKLTDWAIASDYQRASNKHGPFNFLRKEE